MQTDDLASYEQLIPDERLQRTLNKVLGDAAEGFDFVSFIQAATTRQARNGLVVPVAPMAVFMVMSADPKRPGSKIGTTGTVSLANWRDAQREYEHYAGRGDPLENILRILLTKHVDTIKNLQELN